jgi:hypothetical protein
MDMILLLSVMATLVSGACRNAVLFEAVYANDAQRIDAVLREHPEFANEYDSRGCTALCDAAAIGYLEALKMLSDWGVDVDMYCNPSCGTGIVRDESLAKLELPIGCDIECDESILFDAVYSNDAARIREIIAEHPEYTKRYNAYGCLAICEARDMALAESFIAVLHGAPFATEPWCSKYCGRTLPYGKKTERATRSKPENVPVNCEE